MIFALLLLLPPRPSFVEAKSEFNYAKFNWRKAPLKVPQLLSVSLERLAKRFTFQSAALS